MKVYRIPEKCQAILFDMDSTLYTHPQYARSQIDLPIEKLALLRGLSFHEMNNEIKLFRQNYAEEHEGRQISLGNIFTAYGVSIGETVKWREELYQPEKYLAPDERLRSALEQLASRFTLAVVTNNPVSIALRTIATLGVEDLFNRKIVGLDTCGVSKPNAQPLMQAVKLCDAMSETCISVGDRYDIDIALPLELGMGGILVDGAADVYQLPPVLIPNFETAIRAATQAPLPLPAGG